MKSGLQFPKARTLHSILRQIIITGMGFLIGTGNLQAINGFMLVQNRLQNDKNTLFFVRINEKNPVRMSLKVKPKSAGYYCIQKKWEQNQPEFQESFTLEKGDYWFLLEIENTQTGEKAEWKKEYECNPPENGVYLSDITLKPDQSPFPFFSGEIEGENTVKSLGFSQNARFPQKVLTARAILYKEKKTTKSETAATAYTSLQQINQVLKTAPSGVTLSGAFDISRLTTGNYLIEILWYDDAKLTGERSIPFSIVTEAYYWQDRNIEESIRKAALLLEKEQIKTLLQIPSVPEKKSALKSVWKTLYPVDSEQQAYTFYEKVRKAEELFATEPLTWQSDRAMTYIRYGEPEETRKFHTRNGDFEGWIYPQWDLMFMFKKVGNAYYLVK